MNKRVIKANPLVFYKEGLLEKERELKNSKRRKKIDNKSSTSMNF